MTGRKRDFTFRQLSSFVAAARSGSFAHAADQLGISQPAISDHVSALERHLGYALFERRRGTTPRLTPQGVEMLHRAESLLRTSEDMRFDKERTGFNGRTRIRVSAGPRLREVYLKPLLPRLYADHPDLEIEIVPVLPLRAVPAAMEKGDIDLLLYTVGRYPENLTNIRLLREVPIAIVAAPELATRIASGTMALEDATFILPDNGIASEQWLEHLLADASVTVRHPFRYIEFADVVQSMVEGGFGVSILMVEQVRDAIREGKLVQIGPTLPAMKRVIARAPSAPRGTDLLEKRLIRVFSATP